MYYVNIAYLNFSFLMCQMMTANLSQRDRIFRSHDLTTTTSQNGDQHSVEKYEQSDRQNNNKYRIYISAPFDV